MTTVATSAPKLEPGENRSRDPASKQIRGSSLLLVGKLLSVGAKLGGQVLVVRYLSTSDYGAWAYALAAVALLGGFAHLSLDRTVTRFTSIYHEQGQIERFFGAIALVLGTVVVTGMVFVAALYASPDLFARLIGGEARPLALLFVMIFLVPLEAIDAVLVSIFATFSRARSIFIRNYVVAPAIQVGIVLLLIAFNADVMFLAYGYLAGALCGVLLSFWLLLRILREQGLLQQFSLRRITVPAREMFTFSFPLMTSDWHSALTQASGALVLGYFHGTEAVGFLRVVLPVAVLNQLVIRSFHMLYVPNASRLFAKGDLAGVNDLYWRTSLWIAVLTFPIFAVTFATATPLTTMLFGERYEASGLILAIMAVGQYVQASFGFNGATLMVIGKVKFLVGINLGATIANIVLTLLLVRPFGAVGAAIALSATMVVHNLLKQLGLRATGSKMVDRRYASAYQVLVAVALGLVFARVAGISHFVLLALAAVAGSLLVLHSTRRALNILEVFPEVRRVPLLRLLWT
jgi:O-antigen/teichoic acid export membrane protein